MADTFVITGAAGFIGSHLAQRLLASGARVVGIDNFDPFYDLAMKRANVALLQHKDFTLHEADITDSAAMQRIIADANPAAVIHLAAKAGVRPSIADPVGYTIANVVGTASILAACKHAATLAAPFPVVVASSSSVYGNCDTAPFSETLDVSQPISPYAATKKSCELLGHTHWSLTRQPVAMLRFFTVYGPRQRPDLAIAAFMKRISEGQSINVFGDGSMTRDFTYVDDIVDGILGAARAISMHGYRVWNLGHDHPVRLDAMIATIEAAVGRNAVINRLPDQPGDVKQTWADLTRSRAEIGYNPKVSFADGVSRQWEWMQRA